MVRNQAHVPPQRWLRPVHEPTEGGSSWGHACSSPPQRLSGWPVPYVNETDRYGPTARGTGPWVRPVCPAVADASESGITELGFTHEENGAIKRQLFKWCESAMQLLAMPSKRREWHAVSLSHSLCLHVSLNKAQSSG